MLVTCQNCHRVYKVSDSLLKDGEHTFKCQICGFTWTTLLEREEPEETDKVQDISSETITAEFSDIDRDENAVHPTEADIKTASEEIPQEAPIPVVATPDETLSEVVEFIPNDMKEVEETRTDPSDSEKTPQTHEDTTGIPQLEDFEETLKAKDYSRFAPKESEPSPFEEKEPEMPTAFIDPEQKEPMPVAEEFPVFEIPTEEQKETLKEEPLLPVRKKGNILWGLIGYFLFLTVFALLVLWLGEPLIRRFIPSSNPFYDRVNDIYEEFSENVASMKGMEYVHAIYKKIDIRTKAAGQGLDFKNVNPNIVYENNTPVLLITGEIVNLTDEEKILPFLSFVVYDNAENELQNVVNVTSKETLNAHGKLPFKGRISPLHPDAHRLDVTFRKE